VQIEEIMTRFPATCRPDHTLSEAAWTMWINNCGCLPVIDESRRVVGVITDRDICIATVLIGASLQDIWVAEAMAKDVYTCGPKDSLVEAQAIMQEARVRRLPVVDASTRLVGVISLADLAREAGRERGEGNGGITKAEIGKVLATLCNMRRGSGRANPNQFERRAAELDSAS
jgi:CBS domain-containing protein